MSLGEYTIVLVINVAASVLSSWSTCVIFLLGQSQVIASVQFITEFTMAICVCSIFRLQVHHAEGSVLRSKHKRWPSVRFSAFKFVPLAHVISESPNHHVCFNGQMETIRAIALLLICKRLPGHFPEAISCVRLQVGLITGMEIRRGVLYMIN